MPTMLVFGLGYLGEAVARRLRADGWSIRVTARDPERRQMLASEGAPAIDPNDGAAMAAAVAESDAILVTAPPGAEGCPGLIALAPHLKGWRGRWIGYVSSTAVYGDRGGSWVDEGSALNAATIPGARRVAAERGWLDLGAQEGLAIHVFRLPAIYGPGRSAVDRLREGTARPVRKPGQVFNRIHVEDAASGILASLARPRAGAIYNLTDDDPASAESVLEAAAARMGLPLPPETDLSDPSVSEAMRGFYLDSKRVSNARAKAELGWRPAFPTWREGLESLLAD
ncbi:SDR family oxidoreductase [Brevundimonas sp.]|uniref:SDR family oxidoreductase n=1 Tax=Brevundimonas sp. TaxID=1871086 RepID=UPI0025EBD26A|nr:SDR family oxidoreductase [Brevundimonas sp.]